MKLRWQQWRRPLGGCLIVILVPVIAVGWFLNQLSTPYQSEAWISPQGQWRVWLERPNGSMEPMYYTLKARRESVFATPICEVASLSNWFAERYTRVVWPAPNRMRFEYGLAARDTGGAGVPRSLPLPEACAGLRVEMRHDRSLDAEATRTNDNNHNYAVPVPEPSSPMILTPTDTSSPSPLS